MNDPWWVWLITLAGPVCLVAGILLNRRDEGERDRSWVRTDGRMLGWHQGTQEASVSRPIVRFDTAEGHRVRGLPRWAWNVGIHPQPRKAIPVWYDPENPERFDARVWLLDRRWMLLMLIGAVLSLMFVVFPGFIWLISQ